MKTSTLVIVVMVGLALAGCMKVGNERELMGKYRAELPGGAVEWLELLPKGECVQEIRLKNGTTYKAEGKWQYSPDTKYLTLRGTRLALTPTQELNPNISQIPAGTTGSLPVSRSFRGNVTIMLHQDVEYQKQ